MGLVTESANALNVNAVTKPILPGAGRSAVSEQEMRLTSWKPWCTHSSSCSTAQARTPVSGDSSARHRAAVLICVQGHKAATEGNCGGGIYHKCTHLHVRQTYFQDPSPPDLLQKWIGYRWARLLWQLNICRHADFGCEINAGAKDRFRPPTRLLWQCGRHTGDVNTYLRTA